MPRGSMQSAGKGLFAAGYVAGAVVRLAVITGSASGAGDLGRTCGGGTSYSSCRSSTGYNCGVGCQAGLQLLAQVSGDVDRFLHVTRVLLGVECDIDNVTNFR